MYKEQIYYFMKKKHAGLDIFRFTSLLLIAERKHNLILLSKFIRVYAQPKARFVVYKMSSEANDCLI